MTDLIRVLNEAGRSGSAGGEMRLKTKQAEAVS